MTKHWGRYGVPWPKFCEFQGIFWPPNMRFFSEMNILNLQKQQGPYTDSARALIMNEQPIWHYENQTIVSFVILIHKS